MAVLIDKLILDGSGSKGSNITVATVKLASTASSGRVIATRATEPQPGIAAASKATPPAPAKFKPLLELTSSKASDYHDGSPGTYKTYCVRLCDGYFWPISFSTTSDHFGQDAARCDSACGTPTRLFVHPTPDASPAEMVSLDGLPYSALKTAFLFRSRYDAQCKCKANPWEAQARNQHRLYAAEEASRKGDAAATSLVKELAKQVADDRDRQSAAKAVAEAATSKQLKQLATTVKIRRPSYAAAARERQRSATLKLAQNTDRSPLEGMMQLGREDRPSKGGWRPATGNRRHWREEVFSGQ